MLLVIITLWSGIKLINSSMDSAFYHHYLKPLDTGFRTYNLTGNPLPHFTGGNHVEYMNTMETLLKQKGINVQKSNTTDYYRYALNKIGEKKQKIFVLFQPGKLIIYGMNESTFLKLKKLITNSNSAIVFTGKKSSSEQYTGIWYL
jgi:hypothetical protein